VADCTFAGFSRLSVPRLVLAGCFPRDCSEIQQGQYIYPAVHGRSILCFTPYGPLAADVCDKSKSVIEIDIQLISPLRI